mgnify:CR=1 FL=1
MDADQLAVTIAGVAAVAVVVWFFWLKKEEGMRAALTSGGYQEATILVQGGYTPDTVVVESGTPVRLVFRREETAACSERVVVPSLGRSVALPPFEDVVVDLGPMPAGEHEFRCGLGALRGRIVVEESRSAAPGSALPTEPGSAAPAEGNRGHWSYAASDDTNR